MAISDKEAFRILDLPLGSDKDAINKQYKNLSFKLAASKSHEDSKRLAKVVEAFHQLIPPLKNRPNNRHLNSSDPYSDDCNEDHIKATLAGRSNHRANDDAANMSAVHALQRKAEKKKEKKKRKKEKRKNNEKSEKYISNNGKTEESDCSSYEGEDDTLTSSDFTSNSSYSYSYTNTGTKNVIFNDHSSNSPNVKKTLLCDNTIDPDFLRNKQLQARSMAVQGNEAAAQGQHQKAVKLFTQAVGYDPNDHRFLGNRSFCYEQLKQFDRALSDADKAIELSNQWPKGHFRRGRALIGLTQYSDAEEAFSRVLQLDPECQEAQEEIISVRRMRLMEMGFTQDQAVQAIDKYKQVQSALDALLSGEFHDSNIFGSESSESEERAPTTEARVMIPATAMSTAKKTNHHGEDIKMNPKNPQGLTSLWVGNVLPEVTEKELQKLFSKYGHVSSVRQLKEKFCAFVNFTDSVSAGRAMDKLQGFSVNGQRLLIKFPDNPINSAIGAVGGTRRRGGLSGTSNISKGPVSPVKVVSDGDYSRNGNCNGATSPSSSEENKPKGPVQGDECYFWRTTGCMFEDTCRHKHMPKNKGIDRKPWQK